MATKKPISKSSIKKKIIIESKIHLDKYLNDNKEIKEIFKPMLKIIFGSRILTPKKWKEVINKELHRKLN